MLILIDCYGYHVILQAGNEAEASLKVVVIWLLDNILYCNYCLPQDSNFHEVIRLTTDGNYVIIDI